ncbi:hypothetical protein LRY60_04985 [Candidatus Woesebacteria bacterium]|nr:hypothetical protein [Candidatus Woesebacteria bacterium]
MLLFRNSKEHSLSTAVEAIQKFIPQAIENIEIPETINMEDPEEIKEWMELVLAENLSIDIVLGQMVKDSLSESESAEQEEINSAEVMSEYDEESLRDQKELALEIDKLLGNEVENSMITLIDVVFAVDRYRGSSHSGAYYEQSESLTKEQDLQFLLESVFDDEQKSKTFFGTLYGVTINSESALKEVKSKHDTTLKRILPEEATQDSAEQLVKYKQQFARILSTVMYGNEGSVRPDSIVFTRTIVDQMDNQLKK